jgi:hypothetical protein
MCPPAAAARTGRRARAHKSPAQADPALFTSPARTRDRTRRGLPGRRPRGFAWGFVSHGESVRATASFVGHRIGVQSCLVGLDGSDDIVVTSPMLCVPSRGSASWSAAGYAPRGIRSNSLSK